MVTALSSLPSIMGIINVTPDSFSGDGLSGNDYVAQAVAQAKQMAADGRNYFGYRRRIPRAPVLSLFLRMKK